MIIRGRGFSDAELELIRAITDEYYRFGRTRISVEVCKALNWKQENGWLKDRACRDVLRTLSKRELLSLPPPLYGERSRQYSKWTVSDDLGDMQLLEVCSVSGPIRLECVKGTSREKQWNRIVQKYHYLGHKVTVGRCMKFILSANEGILGALSLSESAWALSDRDRLLAKLDVSRDQVANNSRFLILPKVRVKNLASRALSLLAKVGVATWNEYYSTELRCLETFVETGRFRGTSYLAANWVNVGQTKGYRKSGGSHLNNQCQKDIFLYPTSANDRKYLRELITSEHGR